MTGQVRIRRPARKPAGRRRPGPARPSAAAQALALLPVREETLRRSAGYVFAGCLVAGLLAGAVAMSLPQMIGTEIGEMVGRAGFAVRNIEVHGRAQMDREAVMNIAMDQRSRAMPLVDLEGTRQRLRALGWIADARVSRRLPDTLVIDIVERRPTAIWQFQRRLALIDQTGTVIAPIGLEDIPDLPIVIGPGANTRLDQLADLVGTAPALKPMLAAATWVGQRRWDLKFQSGEVLALPEGDVAAADALKDFARRDAEHRLLGQGFARFDMRVPGRIVVRVSRVPGRNVIEDLAPLPAAETKSI